VCARAITPAPPGAGIANHATLCGDNLDGCRAEEAGAAQARAETAERARDEAARELAAAEVLATLAQAEAERFQKAPGLQGRAIRWLAQ